jgi:nucleotide-binding universal stress UspA family protein
MLPFQRILFPVDYSEPCLAVAPYVQEMMRHFSADLTLVHAYAPEFARTDPAITDPDFPEKVRLLEEQRLREFAGKTFPGQHVESIAELGEPGSIIHKVVQHQGTDLVMLATHGRGPVRRFLLGSVAAKVLHDIGAAVWTGVGTVFADHTPSLPYKSVLCALDDSEEAQGVLKAAAAFASGHKARLSIVHVVETPPMTFEIDFSPYKKDLMEAADFKVRELKGELGIDAPHAVIDARVSDGIRQEAGRRNADIIITGRGHAQATFSTIWSRLYPIVRESPCPVLSI